MARKPTTFSKVSTGYNDSVNTVGESGYDLGFIDGYGTTLTLATSLNVAGGTALTGLSATTHSIDFGAVSGENASLKTVGIAGATGDDVLLITRPSTWSGAAYNVLTVAAQSGDTTGEVNVICFNSGTTNTDPAAAVFSILRIAF